MIAAIWFLTSFCFCLGNSRAGSFVGGEIDSDTIWTLEGSPYFVESPLRITAGATLTIEAGVEVLFRGNYEFIVAEGALVAVGTPSNLIRLTYDHGTPGSTWWGGIGVWQNGKVNISFSVISYSNYGISLLNPPIAGEESNNITNNIMTHNTYGIWVGHESSENYIAGNNISHSAKYGIFLYSGHHNTIVHNVVYNSSECGLCVGNVTTNSTIAYNDFVGNRNIAIGFDIWGYWSDTRDNHIHHNNLVGNKIQAIDNGSNEWDNGYPSGGNFWADYGGQDNFHGPNQDIPGADGIGDAPYTIDNDTADRYPLMDPVPHDGCEPFLDDIEPVAEAGNDTLVYVGDNVTFDARGSTDNAGIENFTWSLRNEEGELVGVWYTESFTFSFSEAGSFSATLSIRDFGQNVAKDTVHVSVSETSAEAGNGIPYLPAIVVVLAFIVLTACLAYLLYLLRRRNRR